MLPHNSVSGFGWVFKGKKKGKGKKVMGIAKGRGKQGKGRGGRREGKGKGKWERGEGRGPIREASRAKMLLSETLIFYKSRVSAKRADTNSFPRHLMVSYGISVYDSFSLQQRQFKLPLPMSCFVLH